MSQALKRENDKLRIAHGEEGGFASYQWQFSENLFFPFRKGTEWDYQANEAGILIAVPVFELKKMVPWCHRQWILCRFVPPPSETRWKNQFGSKVDYPRNGYYAPTNVELDSGISPWDCDSGSASITDILIKMAANDRAKTAAQLDSEGEAILAKREAALDQRRSDMIEDLLIPFPNSPHVPGTRGGPISFGGS